MAALCRTRAWRASVPRGWCATCSRGLFDAPGQCQVPDQEGYFHVEHDLRKCVSPLCGGYWVSLVNKKDDDVLRRDSE